MVAWQNVTRFLSGNRSVPYDEITVYTVPINFTSVSYGAPRVAQAVPCCPGGVVQNPVTGKAMANQVLAYADMASRGNRFTFITYAFDQGGAGSFGQSFLFSDTDVYPPAPGSRGGDCYPTWIVPTVLGATGGGVTAAALVGVLVARWRGRRGKGQEETRPRQASERSRLLP